MLRFFLASLALLLFWLLGWLLISCWLVSAVTAALAQMLGAVFG